MGNKDIKHIILAGLGAAALGAVDLLITYLNSKEAKKEKENS